MPGQVPLGEAGAFWRPVEAPPRLQHEAVDFSPPRIGNRDDSQGEIFAPHDGGRIPFGRALHRRHVRKPGQTRSCRLRGRGYLNPEVLVGSPCEDVLQLAVQRPRHQQQGREDHRAQHDDDKHGHDLCFVSAHVAQEFLVQKAQGVSPSDPARAPGTQSGSVLIQSSIDIIDCAP